MRRVLLVLTGCAMMSAPVHAEKHFAPAMQADVGLALGPWGTDQPDEGGVIVAGMVSLRGFKRFGKFRGGKWDNRTALEFGGTALFGGLIANNGVEPGEPMRVETAGFNIRGTATARLWSRWQGIGAFVRVSSDSVPNAMADVTIKEQTTTGGVVLSVGTHHWDVPGLITGSFKWEPLPDMRLDRFSIEAHLSMLLYLFVEYRRFGLEEGLVRNGHELVISFGWSVYSLAKMSSWQKHNKKNKKK